MISSKSCHTSHRRNHLTGNQYSVS